jgi:alpha-D-ribose 1-methylphosphonate 5-triphosphate diphosphatase PhnM
MVKPLETVLTIKVEYADKLPKTAMPRTRFNWVSNNAMHANHAQLVSNSIDLPIVAQHQLQSDQHANAINSSTQPLTNVLTAKMVNSQETVLTIKMVFAEPLIKTAMLRDKFNWINSIAIDAMHAQLVRH